MTNSADQWDAFRIVNAEPPPPRDQWGAFRVTEEPRSPMTTGEFLRLFAGTGLGLVDNAVRTLARGASFNFADELAAAGNATVGAVTGQPGSWGERYAANLQAERARDAGFDQRNPMLSVAGQIAGGAAVPLRFMGSAGSMPGAMARSAVTGATLGGVAGFGQGEGGAVPRAMNAAEGALLGGAIGAAVPPAMAGAAGVGNLVGRMTGMVDRTAPAQRLALRDFERDAVTPAEVLRRAEEAGTAPVGIVDLVGENTRQAGAAIARMPGEGQRRATELLAERSGPAQAERLRDTIRRTINADDYRAEMQALLDQRSQGARPLYDRAWSIRVPGTVVESLEPIVSGRVGQEALRRGLNVMEEEGRALYLQAIRQGEAPAQAQRFLFDPESVGAVRGENGQWVLEGRMENLRLFDAVKRGLDELSRENVNPQTGRPTQLGLQYERQRSELVSILRDRFPVYAQALDAWAGPSYLMDAMRLGRRILSDGAEQADVSAREIARLTPGEQEFFRLGVARGLMDRVNASADGAEATRVRQMFGSELVRERLRAAFNSDEEFRQFARMLEQETAIAQTNRAVNPASGSPTMPLTARHEDLANPPRGPILGSLMGAEPNDSGLNLGALLRAQRLGGTDYTAQVLQEQMSRGGRARNLERNAGDYGRILFTTNADERVRLARALVERELADAARGRLSGSLARSLQRGAGNVGGQYDGPGLPPAAAR